ncbi:MAG: PEP/pyruvate-binding domain-containing protein [Anaerolineales bacterium]|jgi:pyruvate,water dikinase
MPQIFTLPLADPQATLETVGGKGASLARLSAAGLPVPKGFYVTTGAYRRFVSLHALQDQILTASSAASPDRPEMLDEASLHIRRLFAQKVMPEDIAQAIGRSYSELGGEELSVAVRSSATAEDLPEMSFAGQLDTYLNVHGETMVVEAVKRCWASLWTARAISYRARNGIAPQDVSLAVVIQELVPADAAGIMFTANPLTGARDRVVINAAWGLGEAIVGGHVTPDTVVVDKVHGKITEQQISRKDAMTVRTPVGTHEEPVPADRRSQAVLNPAQAAELARIGAQVEELYGQPMDIEWALDHGRFSLLQARPITTWRGHNPAVGEWNDSLAGDYLWTRANYGEAVPDVMTPCTWSLVQILLDNADPSLGPYGPYSQYGNIGGRLFNNLSMAASVAAAFGINPRRFAKMIETGFGRLPEGLEIPIVPLSRWHVLRIALPLAIRTFSRMRTDLKRLPAFLAEAPARCEALKARIQVAQSSTELAALWQAEIAPFFLECCHMVQATANQGGAAILTIPRNLQKLVGEEDANALLTVPDTGSGQLASLGPLLGLTQVAKGEIDRAAFARQFGHRSPHEAEVSIPRPAEDPDWIDQQLAGLRQAREDVTALLARQETARKAAWERAHERYPRKESSIRRQIDHWAAIARQREAARSEMVRAIWVLRAFVQRAGALTGQGKNIFFLSIDEILNMLGGSQACLVYIPARRAAYERYCSLPPYPVLIRGRFDPFRWASDPERRSDLFNPLGGSRHASGAITGFPGAAGVVEGRARVIATFEEGDQLQAGEILVTNLTNVGWTPLFPRAAAVVTDVGAPLSHAAIVARELGIPAVVGCGDATMRLHTGDQVRVDGGRGTVEILRAAQ